MHPLRLADLHIDQSGVGQSLLELRMGEGARDAWVYYRVEPDSLRRLSDVLSTEQVVVA